MKSKFKHKLLSLILMLSLMTAYIPGFSVEASESVFFDDFESYTVGQSLGQRVDGTSNHKGYLRWSTDDVGGNEENKYLIIKRDEGASRDARLAKEFSEEPADDVIVSLEFMMPENPANYSAKLFAVQSDDGSSESAYIHLENGTLYDYRFTGSYDRQSNVEKTPIRTGLEQGKWYSAFLHLDLVNDTYTLYSGGYKSETKDFLMTVNTFTDLLFYVRVSNFTDPLYFDNVDVAAITHKDLDLALYQAKGLLLDSEIGYEDGNYPETTYNMLLDSYNNVKENIENSTPTDAEADEYAEALNETITTFINSRIDTSATDGVARYIKFNLPEDIVVGDESCNRQLSATAYDKANQEVDSEFTWSIEEGLEGVTLSGDTLTVAGGVRGEIVLKASTGNLYDYYTLNLTDGIHINSINIESADGNINVTGSFASKPLEDVTISVTGDDIDVEDILTIASDASFSWSENVGSDKEFQFMTVHFEGSDIVPYSITVPFYGVGWQDAVLTAFNAAQSEGDVEELVTTYSKGLNLPIELYNLNQSEYDSAIFEGIPYSELPELAEVVENLECVLSFEQATSETIRTVVESHKDLLAENGFNSGAYDALNDDEKFVFYASVMELTFDSETDAVTDIADELNTILENIDNPSSGEESVSKATESFFSDDFESYEIGSRAGGGGYITWGGDKILGDTSNQYLQMLREADSRARIALDYTEEPDAEQVIISWEFMMPEAPNKYNADVMGVLSDDGNKPSAYIHLENGVLYDGKTTSTNPVKSGLKQGKWYNAFLLVDLENDKYTLYIDEFKSTENNFLNAVQNMTDIFFNIEVYNYDVPLYFDNFDLSLVKHSELATALYRARSIMQNSDIGYSSGQYPQTAYNMLKNTYDAMYSASCNPEMTAEQSEVYADALNDAIGKFASNKIGAGASNTESYILFDIPDALGVDSVTGYSGTLNASVYNSNNQELSKTIVWTLADNYPGVSIVGNQLRVAKEARGNIVIRASVGGIYDEHKLKLTDCKAVESMDVDTRGGKINIIGELSAVPLEDVNVTVDGSVDIEGIFSITDNGEFSYSQNIDATLPYGSITVTVTGNDTTYYQKEVPFYGTGWEDEVLREFNGASSAQDMGNKISKFYVGLDLDFKEYNNYSEDYSTRIYNEGTDYTSFTELKNAVENQQCIVAFYEVTRADVESVFSNHMDTLERNGFNKTAFNALTPDKKTGLYASALAIHIDTANSTVSALAGELNKLVGTPSSSDIIENPDDGESESNDGGHIGGGLGNSPGGSSGGSSGGGSGKDNGYKIELVPGGETTTPENPGNQEIPSSTVPFADANLAPWANDALLFVREKGIMIGDGTNVRPTDVVTRGEFAKILAVAFELADKDSGNPFGDSRGQWWEEYAKLVNAYGVMNGVETTTFGGNQHITRQMMAVAIYRVLNVNGKELYDQNAGVEFSDSDAIADYAKEAIDFLARKGVVSGVGNGLFAPEVTVKRAEVAQIIYNILSVE